MMKTHKPSGHRWTCVSKFQEALDYRTLPYDDCISSDGEILVPGSDDERSSSKRASKRRKIEQLADSFLNGQDVVFLSSRPSANDVYKDVERLASESILELDHSIPAPQLNSNSACWEDVQDDKKILLKYRASPDPFFDSKPAKGRSTMSKFQRTISEVTSRSHLQRKRKSNAPKLLRSGPSEEALAQAAALRNRVTRPKGSLVQKSRLSRLWSDTPADGSPSKKPRRISGGNQSSPHTISRQVQMDQSNIDTTLDASNLESCASMVEDIDTESTPIGETAQSAIPSPPRSALETLTTNAVSGLVDDLSMGTHSAETQFDCGGRVSETIIEGPLDTAQPGPESDQYEPQPPSDNIGQSLLDESQESQAALLKRLLVAPRKSWASMNESATTSHEEEPKQQDNAVARSSSSFEFRQLLQDSAQLAGKKTTKRSKSSGKVASKVSEKTTRRRTLPTESQNALIEMQNAPVDQQRQMATFRPEAEKPAYTAMDATQSGSTPFMFRKRSKGPGNDEINEDNQQPAVMIGTDLDGNHKTHVSANAPKLDFSFGHDSSFAPGLNMALVDKHLNSKLPKSPGSNRVSSVVKKALRRELRNSGATLTRTGSSKTDSGDSQELQGRGHLPADVQDIEGGPSAEEQGPVETWPGTQALLDQAHLNFFSSPVKSRPLNPLDRTPHESVRKPLQQLSQEKSLPATGPGDVYMWSPWSTVKNLKSGTSNNLQGTPLPSKTDGGQDPGTVRVGQTAGGNPVDSFTEAARRRSSLRFATSMNDSPVSQTPLPFSISKSQSSVGSEGHSKAAVNPAQSVAPNDSAPFATMDTPPPAMTALRRNTKIVESSCDFPLRPPNSVFEAAQLPDDHSELERTIDEVTRYTLDVTDIEGVLSQC